MERPALTGDWGGMRSALTELGVDFAPLYTGEIMGNPGGGAYGTGVVYDHLLNLPLTVDLEKMMGWPSSVVFANALWVAGESLSAKYVGNLANVSNISADDGFRLQEFWLEQGFCKNNLSLQTGLIAADNWFFEADSASLFINGTFGAFNLISENLNNPPIYPMAAPALRLRLQPNEKYYLQTAIFYGDSGVESENRSGLNFPFSAGAGALIFSEIGYTPFAGDSNAFSTKMKAGSFVQTKNHADWETLVAGSNDGYKVNYGFYSVVEQDVLRNGSQTVTLFARGSFAPADQNVIDAYADAGINFTGLFPGRAGDVGGIALAYTHTSQSFRQYGQVVNGQGIQSQEVVVELTYSIKMAPWWTIQPDFQFITSPSGSYDCNQAFILGLRTTVNF